MCSCEFCAPVSQFIVQECARDLVLVGELAVPALEALTVILRQGEGVLSNPHHVALAFGALQLVPLELPSAEAYHSAFHAVHEVLFAVIQCHPQVSRDSGKSAMHPAGKAHASVAQCAALLQSDEGSGSASLHPVCTDGFSRFASHWL